MARQESGPRPILRLVIVWVATAALLLLLAWLLPGFHIEGFWSALAAAGLLGLVNALVWPTLVRLALPLTVLTLGLLPLVLNAGLLGLVARILPGVTLDSVWWGVLVTAGLTILTMSLTSLLAIEDDDVVMRQLEHRSRKRRSADAYDSPGVVFLQFDGLSHEVLRRAIRDGNAPTLASWLAKGSHRLTVWVTEWSSQTGASQAGILLGSNEDMPAFRWMEKENGRILVSNRPRHAAEIERRHSTGRGLLFADGASRGNIFTGDAQDAVLTMASAGRKHGRIGAGYYAYFSRPNTTMRTLVGTLAEVGREVHQAAVQRRRDVLPRVHRGGFYPLLRSFTTVITRDVIVATLIGDMNAGRSVIYADFVGYDEVAHHSGVERFDALEALRRMDRDVRRLERAAGACNRHYEFVVLSDHGQSQGATFRTRYGKTLGDVVQQAMGNAQIADGTTDSDVAGDESWGYAGGALEEIAAGPGIAGRVASRAAGRHEDSTEGVVLGPDRDVASAGPAARVGSAADKDVAVLASGNCGLIYLLAEPVRMTRERIDQLYPRLIPTLRAHPGIGFLLIRTESGGSVVLGAEGEHELASGLFTGTDPLAAFGPLAPRQVARTDSFEHCADIMVNSLWDDQTGEVAAFEELVGSHGGLGGEQTRPFLLHPAAWPEPADELVGAEQVHVQLRQWLAHIGQSAYAATRPEGSPSAQTTDSRTA
jgi:uncharacterized membrane protein YvlD (DUF360 family)